MKKYDKMLLILSLPLILAACNGAGGESSKGGDSSDSALSSAQSGPDSSTHESGSISESSSSSIDYTIGWTQDVLDVMTPHLGGHAIPFIDLPGRVLATWIEATSSYDYSQGGYVTEPAHLSILSTGGFDAALAGAAKLTYQKAGWEVEFDRTNLTMHAEDAASGMKLDFYGEYDANDQMYNPQIDVFYNEPFIIPTDGSWRNQTIAALSSIGVQEPHMLPYTYLGTLAEEASILSTPANTVEIMGLVDGWTSYKTEITKAARAAFPRSRKWAEGTETITVGSGYYADTYTGISFTKTFSDGYTVKAVLYARSSTDSYYSSDSTPFLRVTCTH